MGMLPLEHILIVIV